MTNWADIIPTDFSDIPLMGDTGPSLEDIEKELTELVHLPCDIRSEDDPETSHECRDARGADAAAHIGRIPDAFECFHLICSGKYALWDMVPAILQLASPVKIKNLHIATLGFSRQNISDMADMLDRRVIENIGLLCSHYFKGTSNGIWEFAQAEFQKRADRTKFLSIRTHCKILAVKLLDGRTITIESSANLRSCKNIEQMTIFGHPDVHAFHVGWMDELFARGN